MPSAEPNGTTRRCCLSIRRGAEDTAKRKVSEMKYALQVEMHLFKEQILERYLNVASFGWLLVPAR